MSSKPPPSSFPSDRSAHTDPESRDAPIVEIERIAIEARLDAVRALIDAVRSKRVQETTIHDLRVACRRAEAAIVAIPESVDPKRIRKIRKVLAQIRRYAGTERDAAVHRMLVEQFSTTHGHESVDDVQLSLHESSKRASKSLLRMLDAELATKFKRRSRRLARSMGAAESSEKLARISDRIGRFVSRVQSFADDDLSDLRRLHALRIDCKQLRYLLELPGISISDTESQIVDRAIDMLRGMQELFGSVNDLDGLASAVNERVRMQRLQGRDDLSTELASLHARVIRRRDQAHEQAMAGWLAAREQIASALRAIHDGGSSAAVGVVDIGTNSVRLMVVRREANDSFSVIERDRSMTRLGETLQNTGMLSNAAMARTLRAVSRFVRVAGSNAEQTIVIATAAMRRASNGAAFAERIARETGASVEILDGRREAELGWLGAMRTKGPFEGPWALVDIGGGSTELVVAEAGRIVCSASAPVGAVVLTEQFGSEFEANQLTDVRQFVEEAIERAFGQPPHCRTIVATGGTAETVSAALLLDGTRPPTDGAQVSASSVCALSRELLAMPLSRRLAMRGIPVDRADIIPMGALILDRVLTMLDAEHMMLHTGGVMLGRAIELLE